MNHTVVHNKSRPLLLSSAFPVHHHQLSFNSKLQSAQNKRKPCNAAGRPTTYSALPRVPSASSNQPVRQEIRAKLCSESILKYPPSFCGLKPSVVEQFTENVQSGYERPLNTLRIFEGIPAKHAEIRQPKSKQPHPLSHFEELQQCEVCSCTLFLLGSPTNKSHKH
jgi:hypothetical protein